MKSGAASIAIGACLLLGGSGVLGAASEPIRVGASLAWDPGVVTLRAGGLVPVARQYPGAEEFVEAHRATFPGADLSYHTAVGYAICQMHLAAVARARSLDREAVRRAILGMDVKTVFGAFRVDADCVQVALRMLLFQWQDGRKVVVWPRELAPRAPRFPTPPWSRRP